MFPVIFQLLTPKVVKAIMAMYLKRMTLTTKWKSL